MALGSMPGYRYKIGKMGTRSSTPTGYIQYDLGTVQRAEVQLFRYEHWRVLRSLSGHWQLVPFQRLAEGLQRTQCWGCCTGWVPGQGGWGVDGGSFHFKVLVSGAVAAGCSPL